MYKFFYIITIVIIISILLSCNQDKEIIIENIFEENLAENKQLKKDDSSITVAISAMISPKETFKYYGELLDYISKKLNKKIIYKQYPSYSEVNNLLISNKVDFAFICSGAYIRDKNDLKILVAPVCKGMPYYQAYIITHKKNNIRNFNSFFNKSFAYTDPMSNTGKLYVEKLLKEKNISSDKFFSSIIYSKSHDISIQLVQKNIVDGATVDGLIYEYYLKFSPNKVSNINVIHKSKYFGIPPIVTNNKIDEKLFTSIQEIFLNMKTDETGKEILDKLMIDYFTVVSDTIYNDILNNYKFVCK